MKEADSADCPAMQAASASVSLPQSASDNRELSTYESQLSNQQLVQLIEMSEIALAIVDPTKNHLKFCTTQWRQIVSAQADDKVWSQVLARSAVLANEPFNVVFDDAGQLLTGPAEMQAAEKQSSNMSSWQLNIKLFSDGTVALMLRKSASNANDVHSYMQARESMFTTSRTISVSEMATTLAHEIKQPIATITNILKGLSLKLRRDAVSPEETQSALLKALEQAEFTNSIITRIRDFTRSRRPQQQELDVAELVRESLSLMDWLLSTNQCGVKLIVGSEPVLCLGDATMLQQVFINLLRNGIEAMQERNPDDRLLIIECKRRKNMTKISIRDHGHGLDGKEESLFVPFTTSKANGMGVGLNICRSFVELHQGRLWLSPNSDGGCTSNVELPLIERKINEQPTSLHN